MVCARDNSSAVAGAPCVDPLPSPVPAAKLAGRNAAFGSGTPDSIVDVPSPGAIAGRSCDGEPSGATIKAGLGRIPPDPAESPSATALEGCGDCAPDGAAKCDLSWGEHIAAALREKV